MARALVAVVVFAELVVQVVLKSDFCAGCGGACMQGGGGYGGREGGAVREEGGLYSLLDGADKFSDW